MSKRLTKEEFVEKAKKVHGDDYDYSEVEYIDSHKKVKIWCNTCKKFFLQCPNKHLSGHHCPICAKILNIKHTVDTVHKKMLTTEEYIERVRQRYGDYYDYSLIEIDRTKSLEDNIITIGCPKHGLFQMSALKFLYKKEGCTKCAYKTLSEEEFIQKCCELYGDTYGYSKTHYVGTKCQVIIDCPKHGEVKMNARNLLEGNGCIKCHGSKGEIAIDKWLDDHCVNHEREYSFSDCRDIRPLPFDFFLPEYNCCIEYQGLQHYVEISSRIGKLEYVQKHDKIKKQYCLDHDLIYYEITCKDNIHQKLNELLEIIANQKHELLPVCKDTLVLNLNNLMTRRN